MWVPATSRVSRTSALSSGARGSRGSVEPYVVRQESGGGGWSTSFYTLVHSADRAKAVATKWTLTLSMAQRQPAKRSQPTRTYGHLPQCRLCNGTMGGGGVGPWGRASTQARAAPWNSHCHVSSPRQKLRRKPNDDPTEPG